MEGIVVKVERNSSLGEKYRAAKLVREEFTNQITVHYRREKAEYNIIDPKKVEYTRFFSKIFQSNIDELR